MPRDTTPPTTEDWTDILRRRKREQARAAACRPKSLQRVISQLLLKRDYARERGAAALSDAWNSVAGEFAESTRAGALRRGKLEVTVENSTIMQELMFQKLDLMRKLNDRLPDETVRDLRFRVGSIR